MASENNVITVNSQIQSATLLKIQHFLRDTNRARTLTERGLYYVRVAALHDILNHTMLCTTIFLLNDPRLPILKVIKNKLYSRIIECFPQ